MKKSHHFSILGCILLVLFSATLAEDYRWIITYPNNTNDWGKKVACGENKTVMKAQFIKITEDNYKLITFAVRPTTSYLSRWLIKSVQLWKNTDNYPGSLDQNADSLISQLDTVAIATQSSPTNRITFTLPGSGITLKDTTTFFITMKFINLHDTLPDNKEITDQNGAQFGITVIKSQNDIVVTPSGRTANNWSGSTEKMYTLRAVNLPIVVYNYFKSAEEDSFHFLPHFRGVNNTSSASKNQKLTDLTFSAYINLPHSNYLVVGQEDRLSYASFKVGWDNTILQLDSLRYGDIWQGKQYQQEGSGFGVVTLDPNNPKYSFIRFEGIVLDNVNYVDIAYNNLAILDFKVIKPGISPIFLSDVTIIDQWGIPYHTYRKLSNNITGGTKYDAWAKFILGDFAGKNTEIRGGYGDGIIDPLTDISLFADYLWLNSDSTSWHKRFDVGSPNSHDPDVLSPDDTTNFYDLMVIGTNYYRSYTGAFNQKMVVPNCAPVRLIISETNEGKTNHQYTVKVGARNLLDLNAAQIKIQFDPLKLKLIDIRPGDLLLKKAPQYWLTYPNRLLENGVLDINLLTLSRPVSGAGELVKIDFQTLSDDAPTIRLESADLRNVACQKLAYQYEHEIVPCLPENFVTLHSYPNPFNPATRIEYAIPQGKEGNYTLQIFDLAGKSVHHCRATYHSAGFYSYIWDGKNDQNQTVGSGIYLVQLSGRGVDLRYKIALVR